MYILHVFTNEVTKWFSDQVIKNFSSPDGERPASRGRERSGDPFIASWSRQVRWGTTRRETIASQTPLLESVSTFGGGVKPSIEECFNQFAILIFNAFISCISSAVGEFISLEESTCWVKNSTNNLYLSCGEMSRSDREGELNRFDIIKPSLGFLSSSFAFSKKSFSPRRGDITHSTLHQAGRTVSCLA